jgi:hypothetical protein
VSSRAGGKELTLSGWRNYRPGLIAWLLLLVLTAPVAAVARTATTDSTAAAVSNDSLAVNVAPDSTVTPPAGPTLDEIMRPKISPTRAVLMTPVFPGWGQLYARNSWRGMLAFGVQWFYWSRLLMYDQRAQRTRDFAGQFPEDSADRAFYDQRAEEYWERMRDYAWWSGAVLLIVAIDAYVGAHLFQFDEDPVPVPTRWDLDGRPIGGPPPGTDVSLVLYRWRTSF